MNKLNIILAAILILVGGCSKKTKSYLEGKDYINLMEEEFKAVPDNSLKGINVVIPAAQKNKHWINSNFNQAKAPENIAVNGFNPANQKKYTLYRDSNIFGSNYTPVIDDGVLFIVDNKNTVHAFDVDNSFKSKWKKSLINKYQSSEFAGGGIAKHQNILIVTYGSNSVVALDAKNGDMLWQYKLSNISRASPVISGELAFIITIDNKIYCFDIHSGVSKWAMSGAVESLGVFGSASPAVGGDKVIAPYSSGQLFAIGVTTGQVIWDVSLIKSQQNSTSLYLNDIDTSPVISDGIVYVANYTGALFAIDLSTGQIKWVNEQAGGNKFVWVIEDFIFTVNKASQLVAVYKLDGAVKWVLDLLPYELKSQKKQKQLGDFTIYSGPVMINGKLYLSSSEGKLFEVDPKDGKLINHYTIPKDIYTPPIAADDKVYLFNNGGSLVVMTK